MMQLVFKSICILCVCVLVDTAKAAQIGYFTAEVPVLTQNRSEQQRAAKQGLFDVLVRVSGSEDVRSNFFISERLGQALSYVSEFQYAEVTREDVRAQGYNHVLKLTYSGRLVRKLLEDAQVPVWSINRPKTLVWLVEDSFEFGKRILPYDETNPLFEGIQKAADYRGLPLTHPLLDFDDQLTLGAERLWQLDELAIKEASLRYNADVILVGKFSTLSSGQVFSSWQYLHANKARVYDLRSDDASQVGYQAVLPLADFLASLYSYHSSGSEYFSLTVVDVNNFADYRGLISTLSSFDTITDVKIDKVVEDEINIRLKSNASIDQVSKQIALARKLFSVPQANTNVPAWEREELGSPQNPLLYRWQR